MPKPKKAFSHVAEIENIIETKQMAAAINGMESNIDKLTRDFKISFKKLLASQAAQLKHRQQEANFYEEKLRHNRLMSNDATHRLHPAHKNLGVNALTHLEKKGITLRRQEGEFDSKDIDGDAVKNSMVSSNEMATVEHGYSPTMLLPTNSDCSKPDYNLFVYRFSLPVLVPQCIDLGGDNLTHNCNKPNITDNDKSDDEEQTNGELSETNVSEHESKTEDSSLSRYLTENAKSHTEETVNSVGSETNVSELKVKIEESIENFTENAKHKAEETDVDVQSDQEMSMDEAKRINGNSLVQANETCLPNSYALDTQVHSQTLSPTMSTMVSDQTQRLQNCAGSFLPSPHMQGSLDHEGFEDEISKNLGVRFEDCEIEALADAVVNLSQRRRNLSPKFAATDSWKYPVNSRYDERQLNMSASRNAGYPVKMDTSMQEHATTIIESCSSADERVDEYTMAPETTSPEGTYIPSSQGKKLQVLDKVSAADREYQRLLMDRSEYKRLSAAEREYRRQAEVESKLRREKMAEFEYQRLLASKSELMRQQRECEGVEQRSVLPKPFSSAVMDCGYTMEDGKQYQDHTKAAAQGSHRAKPNPQLSSKVSPRRPISNNMSESRKQEILTAYFPEGLYGKLGTSDPESFQICWTAQSETKRSPNRTQGSPPNPLYSPTQHTRTAASVGSSQLISGRSQRSLKSPKISPLSQKSSQRSPTKTPRSPSANSHACSQNPSTSKPRSTSAKNVSISEQSLPRLRTAKIDYHPLPSPQAELHCLTDDDGEGQQVVSSIPQYKPHLFPELQMSRIIPTKATDQSLHAHVLGSPEERSPNRDNSGFDLPPFYVDDDNPEFCLAHNTENERGAMAVGDAHCQASGTNNSPNTAQRDNGGINLSLISMLTERIADAASQTMSGFYDFRMWRSLKAIADKLEADFDAIVECALASSGSGDAAAAAAAATKEVNSLVESLSDNNVSLTMAQNPRLGAVQSRLEKLRPTSNKRRNVRAQSLSSKLLPTVLKLGEIIDCFLDNGDSKESSIVEESWEPTKRRAGDRVFTPSMERILRDIRPSSARDTTCPPRHPSTATNATRTGGSYFLTCMVCVCAGLMLGIAVTLGYLTPMSLNLPLLWNPTYTNDD